MKYVIFRLNSTGKLNLQMKVNHVNRVNDEFIYKVSIKQFKEIIESNRLEITGNFIYNKSGTLNFGSYAAFKPELTV